MSGSIYRDADLSHMRGVWAMEGGKLAVVMKTMNCEHPLALSGVRLMEPSHSWNPQGVFFDLRTPHAFNLAEQLGTLDDVRRGAERLRQARCYVPAAMLFGFLGDDEAMHDALQQRREEIERERVEDEKKPF